MTWNIFLVMTLQKKILNISHILSKAVYDQINAFFFPLKINYTTVNLALEQIIQRIVVLFDR